MLSLFTVPISPNKPYLEPNYAAADDYIDQNIIGLVTGNLLSALLIWCLKITGHGLLKQPIQKF